MSTCLYGLPPNFSHALKFRLGRLFSPFRSAGIIGKAGFRKATRGDHVAKATAGSCKTAKMLLSATFLRRSYTASVPLERLRLAELKDAISVAWDVRKKITAFDRAIWAKIFLAQDGTFFFISFFCRTFSVAPYFQYAPAIPVCSILQPCVSARQKSECCCLLDPWSTEHVNMHQQRLQPTGYRKIEDDRRSTKRLNICPSGRAKWPAHRQADY